MNGSTGGASDELRFVDANVFLQLITADDPDHTARCAALFRRVRAGAEQVTTSESVIAEVAYVLTSDIYQVPRDTVRGQLLELLSLRGMRLGKRALYLRTLDLYAEYGQLDFEDALSVAHVERSGAPAILSFDRDFDRVPGVVREEPA